MKYSLGVGVMAVPERQTRVEKLLRVLGLDDSVVSWDADHDGHVQGWWRAAAIACKPTATHALILEDDAEPCRDFLAAVNAVVAKHPDKIISFFTVNQVPLPPTNQLTLVPHSGFSDVAVVYPVPWLESLREDFLVREKELAASRWQVSYGADELRMKLRPQLKMWATYPSLVQHGAPHQSTLGHRFARSIAQPCLASHESALALDWTRL